MFRRLADLRSVATRQVNLADTRNQKASELGVCASNDDTIMRGS